MVLPSTRFQTLNGPTSNSTARLRTPLHQTLNTVYNAVSLPLAATYRATDCSNSAIRVVDAFAIMIWPPPRMM
jgi:hypothetical protein